MSSDEIRYFTKDLLLALNEEAIRVRAEYSIPPVVMQGLPADKRFPVVDHMLEGDTVHLLVGVSPDGDMQVLDVCQLAFRCLPVFGRSLH